MTLHLQKLCVGVSDFEDMERRVAQRSRDGKPYTHLTRMMPKRGDDLVDGGSLYWVIKGAIRARQRILELRPITDRDGTKRCRIVMEPLLVPTERQPRRAFQGWRYLSDKDAPPDLPDSLSAMRDLPEELREELASLGLL